VPGYTASLLGNRDHKLGFAIMTNGDHARPHLFKLADRAIDLLKKYTVTEKAAKSTARVEQWTSTNHSQTMRTFTVMPSRN
jgi:hypothetical protein